MKKLFLPYVNIIITDEYVISHFLLSCHLSSVRQIRDKKLLQKIALVLKELRDEKSVTQDEVYADTNIHIGRIETAKANLSVSTLSTLAKYFKLKLSDFHRKVEEL